MTRLLQVDILISKDQALQILYHVASYNRHLYIVKPYRWLFSRVDGGFGHQDDFVSLSFVVQFNYLNLTYIKLSNLPTIRKPQEIYENLNGV